MLSVIIPTYDRRPLVLRLLDALACQQPASEPFEVIVAVDGSPDDTAAVIPARRWPFALRVLDLPHGGQGAARNRGAAAARGDVLVFLDDDMVPLPDFLREIDAGFADGVDGVVPTLRLGASVPRTLVTRDLDHWRADAIRPHPDAPVRFDELTFCALALRTRWFLRVGGFDEAYTRRGGYGNEDLELGYRLLERGAVFRRRPGAIAETEPLLDPAIALRRERAIGRSDVRMVTDHPALASETFLQRLSESRIHRVVAPALLAAPWLGALAAPLRPVVFRLMEDDAPLGPLRYRLWFGLRAIEYWRGVAEAGGRAVVERARRDGGSSCSA